MKKYELTCMISPELTEAELDKKQEEVVDIVSELKGVISSSKIEPVKRDLGAEVNDFKKSYLSTIIFSLDPSKIAELKEKMKELKDVLRTFILTRNDFEKLSVAPEKKAKKSSPKIELKEIDKKIEEILSE